MLMASLLSLQGRSLPKNDSEAVSKILEEYGLSKQLYQNKKKVQMLTDPLVYLEERNAMLDYFKGTVEHRYERALNDMAISAVQPSVGPPLAGDALRDAKAAAKQQPWVKMLAAQKAKSQVQSELLIADIEYPHQGKAYKAQQSKEKRRMEEKHEMFTMGTE